MKVSILTQPLGHNYGGLLQAYALQSYLKSIGCEVETLDRRAPENRQIRIRQNLINLARLILGRIKSLPTERKNNFVLRHLADFRDSHLAMSPRITTEADLIHYYRQNRFEAVVVGSDQVWRPRYSPSLLNFYLDFLDTVNSDATRLSYGASFGVSEWEYTRETTKACRELIRKFSAVSVREESALGLCHEHFGITPELVVDPTLLLEIADYEKLLPPKATSDKSGRVLSYVLDPAEDKQQIAQKVSGVLGKPVLSIKPQKNLAQVPARDLCDCQYPKVEDWLQAFREAEFVVTDSFHGCVFAILFNRPFIAVGNPTRGLARFHTLLSLVGLESRLISSSQDFSPSFVKEKIDWDNVNRIRQQQAEAGRQFLRRHVLREAMGD